jgi:hypothetical protein
MDGLDLRLLAQPAEQIDASRLRLLVDPLFQVALIEDLPACLYWWAKEIAHLLCGHAELHIIEPTCPDRLLWPGSQG